MILETGVFLFLSLLSAQSLPVGFQRLGNSYDALPEERFTAIFKGSYGFMWFGTARGLIRYDGSAVRWYRHDPDKSDTLSPGNVRVVFEDSRKRLWVGTNGGLNRLDRRTGRVTRFQNDPSDSDTLSDNNIWSLFEDQQGHLWIGTANGLNRFDANRFERFTTKRGLSANDITAIAQDRAGTLWVGTDDSGLNRFLPDKQQFQADPSTKNLKVRALCAGPRGKLWVGTRDQGLLRHSDGGKWTRFKEEGAIASGLLSDQITALACDGRGGLWIGTPNGLNRYAHESRNFSGYQQVPGEDTSLRANGIAGLFSDSDGLLWVATVGEGVEIYNQNRERFGYFRLHGKEAWVVFQGDDPHLWVGTKSGLGKLEPETGVSRWYLTDQIIRSLGTDRSGRFYIGTDTHLFSAESTAGVPNPKPLLSKFRIWRILDDGDDGLWLGTHKGLIRFSPMSGILQHFKADPKGQNGLSHNVISAMTRGAEGKLWLGTFGGGLNGFDPKTGHFENFSKADGNPDSLSADDVLDLCIDSRGTLWVATLSGGLNRLNPGERGFIRYTVDSGFPDNAAVALVPDHQGFLWVHTGVGLVRFDPQRETWVLYRTQDGIDHGSAIPGARFYGNSGREFYLGGTEGLLRIRPEALGTPSHRTPIFTSFKKGGREVAHMLLPGESISLSRHDKSFSLDFANLDFLSPGSQQFAYLREQIDETWVASPSRGQVNYTKYFSYNGKDKLRIKGSNGNGIWNQADLLLYIEKPLWFTWLPALFLLGLILLVGVIYGLISVRERRKRRQLETQALLAEQKREIAEERARIAERRGEVEQRERQVQEQVTAAIQDHMERVSTEIANDLHDGPLGELHGLGFRLMGLRESLVSPEKRGEIDEVANTVIPGLCHNLRNLCGDLLSPDFQYGLDTELDSYTDIIQSTNSGLQIERDFREDGSGISKERKAVLYRIFRTLLKNVGKHANATRALVSLKRLEGQLVLKVEDNGRGFQVPQDWEILKKNKHYGIFMADYFARSLGGRLEVQSSPGCGTSILVTAPVNLKQ